MRIRSIKPEFWRSEDIDALDWDTRLVFIGLWSYVDDNGVGIYKLSSIVSDLFAEDHSRDPQETLRRVSAALDTLETGEMIARYRVEKKRFIYVTAWDSHQRVTHPNKPRFPRPSGDSEAIPETLTRVSRESPEILVPVTEEQRNRGTEEQGKAIALRADDDFDAFWNAYGKKVGKGAAEKAFTKARATTKPAVLIAAATKHADWHRRADTEPRFIPHASTWLNEQRWADERAEPSRAKSRDPKQASTNDMFDAAMQRAIERERNPK